MAKRLPILILLALVAALPAPAGAEDASGTASASVALSPTPARTPAQLRADELDRLFGQLHVASAEVAPAIEQKIWAVWARNDSATAELLLAQATRAMGDEQMPAAEDILDRLIAASPDYTEAWNRRATLNFLARRYDAALSDIDMVLDLEPRHYGALAGRGMIYEAQGRPDEALKAYREALAVHPNMQAVKEAVKRLEKARPDI
ncbi:MAG: tetratricopeptide repeat protein [Hyphomicrobiales bacterium]